MIASMVKVQIGITASQKEALLSWLQEKGILHVTPLMNVPKGWQDNLATRTAYHLAQMQSALEFMRRVETELQIKHKRSLRNLFSSRPTASIADLEETLERLQIDDLLQKIQHTNDQLAELAAQEETLQANAIQLRPWKRLEITGQERRGTARALEALAVLGLSEEELFLQHLSQIPTAIWQEVSRDDKKKQGAIYYEVVCDREDKGKLNEVITRTNANYVDLLLEENSTPNMALEKISHDLDRVFQEREVTFKQARHFLEQKRDLEFAYDALLHRQERELQFDQTAFSSLSFIIGGWIPKTKLTDFEAALTKDLPTAAVEEVELDKNEQPPVMLINNTAMRPFEAVTDIFGRPRFDEIDPSPILALFFLVAFGLALTDAGYGIVMMATMWTVERFFRLKTSMRKMVRLLFYAGATTTIIGALTGGWFGIALENLPPSGLRNLLLSIKLVDPVSNPFSLLIVALSLGVLQLLFAWGVRGYDSWRKGDIFGAIFDSGAWISMVMFVLLWVGTIRHMIPVEYSKPLLTLVLINTAVLILTQGRSYKNVFLKIGAGVMSLYGLVSFMSDVLSYSRLLALGLATGIIGLVVNLIGGMVMDMIPVVGFILAIVVLLVGHVFNLGINTLGAFIHSGRLQFVEFFPKFLEGGGVPYRPFGRVSKYVDNPNDYV